MSGENTVCDTVHGGAAASENPVDFDPVTRLRFVYQVILKHDLNTAGQLAWGSVLRHLLDRDHLAVLVHAVAVLSSQWILVLVFDWELRVSIILAHLILSLLRKIRVIGILLDQALLRLLAVVHGGLDLWSDDGHAGHDALHGDELVDKRCLESAGSHVVAAKIAFKGDVVLLHLLREHAIGRVLQCLLLTLALLLIIFQVLDLAVQLCFKHVECFDRLLQHVLGEVRLVGTEVVQVDFESGLVLGDEGLNTLLLVALRHVLCHSAFHALFVESRGIVLPNLVGCVDLHSYHFGRDQRNYTITI